MAKTKRQSFAPLPLSDAFLASLARTARTLALGPSGGGALSDAVAELSRAYTEEREQLTERSQGQTALAARLAFFLPRDLPKIFGPLAELEPQLRAPRPSLRVLDVGAGLGASTLGLSRWLRLQRVPVERLEVTALERDRGALEVFEALCTEIARLPDEFVPVVLDARVEDVSRARLARDFDLALFGFVLNELSTQLPLPERLAARASLLQEVAGHIAPDGAMVVLEPALKQSTRELMGVRDLLAQTAGPPYVIAPCLHDRPCPMLLGERDWCHQELPFALPKSLAAIAQGAGLRFEGLSYASLVLAQAPRAQVALGTDERLYRLVSERLESKGKLEWFGCGAEGYVRLTRLDREASELNGDFSDARRGAVLRTLDPLEPGARITRQTRVRREN